MAAAKPPGLLLVFRNKLSIHWGSLSQLIFLLGWANNQMVNERLWMTVDSRGLNKGLLRVLKVLKKVFK